MTPLPTRMLIAIWAVSMVVFTFGMDIAGIQMSMPERVVGMGGWSIFFWCIAVKWIGR